MVTNSQRDGNDYYSTCAEARRSRRPVQTSKIYERADQHHTTHDATGRMGGSLPPVKARRRACDFTKPKHGRRRFLRHPTSNECSRDARSSSSDHDRRVSGCPTSRTAHASHCCLAFGTTSVTETSRPCEPVRPLSSSTIDVRARPAAAARRGRRAGGGGRLGRHAGDGADGVPLQDRAREDAARLAPRHGAWLRGALAVRLSSRRRLAAVSQPSLSRRRVSPRASLVSPRVVARPLAISPRLLCVSSRAPSPSLCVFLSRRRVPPRHFLMSSLASCLGDPARRTPRVRGGVEGKRAHTDTPARHRSPE